MRASDRPLGHRALHTRTSTHVFGALRLKFVQTELELRPLCGGCAGLISFHSKRIAPRPLRLATLLLIWNWPTMQQPVSSERAAEETFFTFSDATSNVNSMVSSLIACPGRPRPSWGRQGRASMR